jgi:hypothetical protein
VLHFKFEPAILKPMLLALGASLASIFAYVATPLQEVVNSAIWEEKAAIELISQTYNPKQGDVVPVDVFIQPTSPVQLSEGMLEIQYTKENLAPGFETVAMLATTTPKLSAAKRIFERPLEFIAVAPGNAQVFATLRTKGGTFTKALMIEVAPAKEQDFPTRRDFSGKWNIDLGSIHGQMELKDIARSLSGSYTLSDGNRGQIEGTRDGTTLRVTFYRGSAPSRYFIDAVFDPRPNADLELRGKAKLMLPTGDGNNPWNEDRQYDFYGVAKAR